MQKECNFCKKSFDTNDKNKKCCSASCSAKLKWSDKSFKQKMIKAQTNAQNRPEVKENSSKRMAKRMNDPNVKKEFSERMLKLWSNDEYKERLKESNKKAQNRPEVKAAARIKQKEVQNRPEVKQKIIDNHNTPEFKEASSKRTKKYFSDPKNRLKHSKNKKEYFNIPENRIKHAMILYKNRYKKKNYKLPSGRIIEIQGYENTALDLLLLKYKEDDIFAGDDILNEIKVIEYMGVDKRKHIYIPDIFIKSKNKIIEVKSNYTYHVEKEKNELKKQACIDLGFNFEFMIL